MELKKRNSALDIVRITALYCVISVHFFLNNGFYSTTMASKRMLLMTIMRTGFMVCVPMFIMLTGYLMNRKKLTPGYYMGIVKTYSIYLLASLACILYKHVVLDYHYVPRTVLFGILDFTGANYSWYIEMYIGLFLLIPFLNLMYNGLTSKKQKLVLCATLLVLTSVPSVVNIFNFYVKGWWKTPILSTEYQFILPDWWTTIYPITYYMLGAYLHEFPLKLKKRWNLALLFGSVLVFGLFNYYRSRGGYFNWAKYNDWYGLPNVVMTVLLFAFLSERDTSRFPDFIRKTLMHVSDWCLGAYLVSYIFDNLIYAELNKNVPDMLDRMYYYPLVVPSVFLLSLALSAALNLIYRAVEGLVREALRARKTRKMHLETVPTIETERLILRAWTMADAADMYAYSTDPDVGPSAGWEPHQSIETSKAIISCYMDSRISADWAIVSKENGKVIGSVGLRRSDRKGFAYDLELGYALAKEAWGNGFATEAARAAAAHAFSLPGVKTLLATHFDGNERSRRVLEKLGFEPCGRTELSWRMYDGTKKSENICRLPAERFNAGASETPAMEKAAVR